MVPLSKRLHFIASFVDKEMLIGDIGSDHGYLPRFLLEEGIVDWIYASDNKKGPFLNLKQTFKDMDKSKYQIQLTDGLNLLPKRVNTLMMTGMGGDLIIKIVKENIHLLSNISHIIISPHQNIPMTRYFFTSIGYQIVDEGIIKDEKYYEVIKLIKGNQTLSDEEAYFGPINLLRMDRSFIEKVSARAKELNQLLLLPNISKNRQEELKKEINFINNYVRVI